jgi:hypothetical protein
MTTAAVTPETWHRLAHAESPAIREAAYDGLARFALFSADFAHADALLDLDDPAAHVAAVRAAMLLGARHALPRLEARLDADAELGQEHVASRHHLDRLAGRARGPGPWAHSTERDLDERLAAVPESFVDRSNGGELRAPMLLAMCAGEALLPEAAVDAMRRRDGPAIAKTLRNKALPHQVEEVLARLEGPVRKQAFDRLAAVAVLEATAARAFAAGSPRAALALAWIHGVPVEELCAAPDAATREVVAALARAESATALETAYAAIVGWGLAELAPQAAAAASRLTFLATYARPGVAARIDGALCDALEHEAPSPGALGLLCHLASARAERMLVHAIGAQGVAAAAWLPFLLRAFPTGGVIAAARRVPGVDRGELQERFEFLAELAPTDVVPAESPAIHCEACGHLASAEGVRGVECLGRVLPDPAVACESCGVYGHQQLHGAEPADRFVNPLLVDVTPRAALERLTPDDDPLWSAEVADLAGELARGDRTRAGILDPHSPLVNVRALLRRGDDAGIVRYVSELASSEAAVLVDRDDREALQEAARAAGRRLGREVEVAFASRSPAPRGEHVRAGPKVGRNDPCPCGSGKKYKKCHVA